VIALYEWFDEQARTVFQRWNYSANSGSGLSCPERHPAERLISLERVDEQHTTTDFADTCNHSHIFDVPSGSRCCWKRTDQTESRGRWTAGRDIRQGL